MNFTLDVLDLSHRGSTSIIEIGEDDSSSLRETGL
jgi:hypothetical protein